MTTESKLADFVAAQDAVYLQVRRELPGGRKRTHWIWFIFPQMAGLGFSAMSQRFGIASKAEAAELSQARCLGAALAGMHATDARGDRSNYRRHHGLSR